jgi:hypothetical protein
MARQVDAEEGVRRLLTEEERHQTIECVGVVLETMDTQDGFVLWITPHLA